MAIITEKWNKLFEEADYLEDILNGLAEIQQENGYTDEEMENDLDVALWKAYRKELSNARYDKRTTKKKHEPEYAYYSASTLNRIIRLVVAAVDE